MEQRIQALREELREIELQIEVLQQKKELLQRQLEETSEESEKMSPEEGGRVCPICGFTELEEGARFCGNCGAPLGDLWAEEETEEPAGDEEQEELWEAPAEEPVKHCAFCGEVLKPEARFCVGCGRVVRERSV